MRKAAIICVDDERFILDSLKAQLREELNSEFDIEISESAEEAIDIYNELVTEKIDIPLVISDQIMPGMKGDEFLAFVHNEDFYIRTIMLTGQANLHDVAKAVNKANLFRYIGKPWDKIDFILTVKTAIQSYYAAKEIEEKNHSLTQLNEHLEELVEERTKELNEQKKLVEYKNQEIISSIEYAKKIQKAILPQSEYLSKILREHFIFYKPKDIIGGDFYWASQTDSNIVLVAADCTGHGVPGALISMLGISLLDRAVNHLNIKQSDKILNNLRDELIKSLHQKSGDMPDGMDISLLVLDLENLTAQFSGANNSILIVKNNLIYEYKADKIPIGFHPKMKEAFSRQDITLETNDMIYLFSDGYTDQFDNSDARRYKIKEFKVLLLSIYDKPINEQKEIIEKTFIDWKGRNIQTDDVLVFGIRV